jgi:hypothetical protein
MNAATQSRHRRTRHHQDFAAVKLEVKRAVFQAEFDGVSNEMIGFSLELRVGMGRRYDIVPKFPRRNGHWLSFPETISNRFSDSPSRPFVRR